MTFKAQVLVLLNKYTEQINTVVSDQEDNNTFNGRGDIIFRAERLCSKLEALWVLKEDLG